VPNAGWLKDVWGKLPGDESIEELLAMLEDDGENTKPTDKKQRRQKSGTRKR
jgi:hypothetical protein